MVKSIRYHFNTMLIFANLFASLEKKLLKFQLVCLIHTNLYTVAKCKVENPS